MKKRILLCGVILALGLTACSPTHTADSLRDIRWEVASADPTSYAPPGLDCSWVNQCLDAGKKPNQHLLRETGEVLYVWTYAYDRFLSGTSTVLYLVVDRPKEATWDKVGFEFFDGQWQIGVYEGTLTIKGVSTPIWGISPAGFENGEGQAIALGMADETWAIIVRPVTQNTFQYEVKEFYWK